MRDDHGELRKDLSAGIAALATDTPLTALAVDGAGAQVLQVRLDDIGVPRLVRQRPRPLDALIGPPEPAGTVVIVNAAPDRPGTETAAATLRALLPGAAGHSAPGADVAAILAEELARSPIRQGYELLVAKVDGDSGRVLLSSAGLFAAGARRGASAKLSVRTEVADTQETVFAVVAWNGADPGLLSADSVALAPGRHEVEAELAGPGEVRFVSPAGLARDTRPLSELLAAVPRTRDSLGEAHLICAVEIAGAAAQVAARLDQAGKIVQVIGGHRSPVGPLRVSLVAYGAHREGRTASDRVIVTDWAATGQEVTRSLAMLGAAELGYPHAAQIEDMLHEVQRRLHHRPSSRRTALLVIGDRPPHPATRGGETMPCPKGRDWRTLLRDLEEAHGLTLAAVRDEPSAPGGEAWGRLGATALKPLGHVDPESLGVQLGLIVPPLQRMPIPLVG